MTIAKDSDDKILDQMNSYLSTLKDKWKTLDLHCDPNGAYCREV